MQISKKGLRLTLVIGAVCIIVGVWLRELVEITANFNVICIGTSIVAFGQSFFYISSTKLSSLWFGPKERSLSTSLGVLSLAFGSIIGFILPSIMIKEEDAVFKENGRKKLSKYMLV
jgi:MFS family permease